MDELIRKAEVIDAIADYIRNIDKVYSTGKLSMSDCRDAACSVIADIQSVWSLDAQAAYYKGKFDAFAECIKTLKGLDEGNETDVAAERRNKE